jgi:alpha-1,2-mannosyltransferase
MPRLPRRNRRREETSLKSDGSSRIHDRRLLLFVVLVIAISIPGIVGIFHLLHHPSPGSMVQLLGAFWHVRQGTDSWLPMLGSLAYFHAHPEIPIYSVKLYDTLIYSLVSLLPLALLEKLGLNGNAMLRFLAWSSWLAVWAMGGISALLAKKLLSRREAKLSLASIAAIFLGALFFYPLIKGVGLGQAQTFLSLLFGLLIYLWSTGRERSSGVVVAALAMVKPQFVLVLIWMAVRRRWNAFWSGMIFAALMFGVAVAVFGLHNNLDYIPVLASLSHKAQSHYANQSLFGTLNRMVFNGENLDYHPYVYSPYIPWIYYTTVLSSLAMFALALFYPWGSFKGSTADLAVIGITSVAASPMAWEHHYGIVFPIFAWLWFSYGCWQQHRPWLLGLSYFLCSTFLTPAKLLASIPVLNILQSYLYFGALLLAFLLYRLPWAERRGHLPVI